MKLWFIIAFVGISISPLFADSQECMVEGNLEQADEHIRNTGYVVRECYHCKEPAYELIKIEKTLLEPCHMTGQGDDKALRFDGEILLRFQLKNCKLQGNIKKASLKLTNELLILNYSYVLHNTKDTWYNLADLYDTASNHACKIFTVKTGLDK